MYSRLNFYATSANLEDAGVFNNRHTRTLDVATTGGRLVLLEVNYTAL